MTNMKTGNQQDMTLLAENPDKPQYPYGLRISLDEESLKKLGWEQLPTVGEKMSFTVNVEVVNVNQNDSQDGVRREVGLQITDIGSTTEKESEQNDSMEIPENAARMYVGGVF